MSINAVNNLFGGLKYFGLISFLLLKISVCMSEGSELRALAQVGEKIINQRDLEREIRGRLEYANLSKLEVSAFENKFILATVDRLIERELLLNYGRQKDLVNEDVVKKALLGFIDGMGGEDNARAKLTEQGVNWEAWKSNFSDDLRLLAIAETISKKLPTPQKEEVDKFMKERTTKIFDPLRVRISVIVLNPGNSLWEADQLSLLVEELKKSPEKFAEKARQVSDGASSKNGGAQGMIVKGTYDKSIEDAIYGLKVGEVSDAILFGGKKYIFKVDERRGDLPDEKAKTAMATEVLMVENSRSNLRKLLDELKLKTKIEKFDF
jgi:hypothetical protein